MISLQLVDWYALLGLAVTMILGFGTKCLVDLAGKSLPLDSPNAELEPFWEKLRKMKIAGSMIGYVERPILFAALWISSGWLLTSWLAFKLAYYWQGAKFMEFPDETPDKDKAAWLVSKRQLGSHHAATALVGTGANIVVALVGVAVGKWIRFQW